jgi:aromatic ring-opening dioxygenase LigB subunit
MGVVGACIAPHGAEAIPELAGAMLEGFAETRKGMLRLAGEVAKVIPETIVLATPHSLRLDGVVGVIMTEFTEGSLDGNGKQVRLHCECDRQLANEILKTARLRTLSVVGVGYGTSEGPASCMPMDWGTLIPLWFLLDRSKPAKIVMITPSREIPLENLVDFGRIIAESAERSHRRIFFVASADQGHAHNSDGPYGFNPASKEYDRMVINAVQSNNLRPLLNLSHQFVEDAKPDSLWQLAMLEGVLQTVPMKAVMISYQVPTYFGLLCALFRRDQNKSNCHGS